MAHASENKSGMPSDQAHAIPTVVVFADLIKAGHFTSVNSGFQSENARWMDKGDRVRGRFELVRMGRSYRQTEAIAKAVEVPGRRVANTYELAYYASDGWNGTDWVAAFGSSLVNPDDSRNVAYLWSIGGERELSLRWADRLWCRYDFVLCICE
jgi:hypothetical protein